MVALPMPFQSDEFTGSDIELRLRIELTAQVEELGQELGPYGVSRYEK
jgi:hypothetical protein